MVDGNDVVKMTNVCKEAVEYIRTTNQPFFIEAVTYRWRGHVGPREDLDVGVRRKDDLSVWKKRDPIGRLEKALFKEGYITESELTSLYEEVDTLIEENWKKAEKAAFPDTSSLLNLVYSHS